MSDPREIAKGLTKAQREALAKEPHELWYSQMKWMIALGLMEKRSQRPFKVGITVKREWTPLGLAVRAALQEGA